MSVRYPRKCLMWATEGLSSEGTLDIDIDMEYEYGYKSKYS